MTGLMLAWILSWFGFDRMFIQGVNELFGIQITAAGYYTAFFLVSFLGEVFTAVTGARNIKVHVRKDD